MQHGITMKSGRDAAVRRPYLSLERGSERQLLRGTAKSRRRAIAAKRRSNDLWSMKKFTLLSLVGITSIALTHAGWAADHGVGGGGFGGGGFSGGHAGGGGARAGGAGFGAVSRGGGVGFGM